MRGPRSRTAGYEARRSSLFPAALPGRFLGDASATLFEGCAGRLAEWRDSEQRYRSCSSRSTRVCVSRCSSTPRTAPRLRFARVTRRSNATRPARRGGRRMLAIPRARKSIGLELQRVSAHAHRRASRKRTQALNAGSTLRLPVRRRGSAGRRAVHRHHATQHAERDCARRGAQPAAIDVAQLVTWCWPVPATS